MWKGDKMKILCILLACFSVGVGIFSIFTRIPESVFQQVVMQTYLTHGLLFGVFFLLLSLNVKSKG